jgi:hypothetical protein
LETLSVKSISLRKKALPGHVGFAVVFGSWWLAGEWLSKMQNYQIAIKELFPIVLSLEI